MKRWTTLALGALALAAPAPAFAAGGTLVTSPTSIFTQMVNLSSRAIGDYGFTYGPISLPNGVTFTANPANGGNSGLGSVLGQGCYGLGDNGTWGCDINSNLTFVYAGLDDGQGWFRFSFSNPVGAVGGFTSYVPGYSNAWIRALDINGNVLDEFDLLVAAPISTGISSIDDGAFRGIVRSVDDIYAIEFADAYIVARDIQYGNNTVVPEPGTMVLLGSGLAGVILKARRRRSDA